MKIFQTGSLVIVKECQFHFNFMPIKSVINIRTIFLQKFTVSENSLCASFATNAS